MTRHLHSVPTGTFPPVAVVWSLPDFCLLCHHRPVGLVRIVTGPAVGRVRCPHCRPEEGQTPIPLVLLPMRKDQPKPKDLA